jgi:hypothetical protein
MTREEEQSKFKELESRGWLVQSDGVGCYRFVKGDIMVGCRGEHRGLSWCSEQKVQEYIQKALSLGSK